MTYPATNLNEAVGLVVPDSNALHEVINGEATESVILPNGDTVPTLRKSLVDSFYFTQSTLPWTVGQDETVFNQLREFNGKLYHAPLATTSNPIPMGTAPEGNPQWRSLDLPIEDMVVSAYNSSVAAQQSEIAANNSEIAASNSEQNAALSEYNANISAQSAVSAAATAQTAADNAVAVVTGGTATITPEPGKIPLANSKGEIEPGWLGQESATSAFTMISGGKWVQLKDDFGNSQIVRRIPIHTFEDLNITDCPFTGPLDCFIRQDLTLRPYVDVPVYEASNSGGKAVSQAGKTPWTSINANNARARSEELNSNSVMISQEIWAMLCWNMLAGGFQPRGNTEHGRSHSNLDEFGRRADGRVPNDRSGAAYTLTGSGPMEWSHDGTPFGVMDLVGNVWEWVDGIKMVDGQFIVAEYTGQPESEWSATGVYISETGQFTNVAPSTLNSGSQVWGSMSKDASYSGNERLQRLMIEPIACTSALGGRFYWNLDGERFPLRGGSWYSTSGAGPAALYCSNPRSLASGDFGFRSAFVS
jgi:hypothetical protein